MTSQGSTDRLGLAIHLRPFGVQFSIMLETLLLKMPIKVKNTVGGQFTAPSEMKLPGRCSNTLREES